MVMLDLSAAFDTVNHNILLTRLNEELGICGLALEWFRSYLAKRGQRVSIDGSLSESFSLEYGVVPQGSCLYGYPSPPKFKLVVVKSKPSVQAFCLAI